MEEEEDGGKQGKYKSAPSGERISQREDLGSSVNKRLKSKCTIAD